MNRLKEAWFEFKGIKSTDMGIRLRQMPTRFLPGRNTSRKNVAGRNGSVSYGASSDNDIQVRQECDALDETKFKELWYWLSGTGSLRFSDEPDLAYDASIEKEFVRAPIMPRGTGQRFTVIWICNPHRRQVPEADPIVITESGTELLNPGTAPALPRIEIVGSGDFSLNIGMQTLFFTDVDGGIIVDSELGDALTADGALLANDCIDGDLFQIQPGLNTVSWLLGGADEDLDATGRIEKITITPRWRYR